MPMPKCIPPSRILFLVPLLVSCTIASTPESVAPAVFHVKAPQAQRVSVVGTFTVPPPETIVLKSHRGGIRDPAEAYHDKHRPVLSWRARNAQRRRAARLRSVQSR